MSIPDPATSTPPPPYTMSQFSMKLYTEMGKQNSKKIINKHYRLSTISEDKKLLKRLQDEHEANRKINWSMSSNKLYVYDRHSSFYSTSSSNCPTEIACHREQHHHHHVHSSLPPPDPIPIPQQQTLKATTKTTTHDTRTHTEDLDLLKYESSHYSISNSSINSFNSSVDTHYDSPLMYHQNSPHDDDVDDDEESKSSTKTKDVTDADTYTLEF